MTKCLTCGGEVLLSNGRYHCLYCGNAYSLAEYPAKIQPDVETCSNEGINVFEKTMNGVLEITCIMPGGISSGSGFLIDESGHAITNTHVVTHNNRACDEIKVKIAGQSTCAKVVALGDDAGGLGNGVDLALLRLEKVPNNAVVIKLGNSERVRIGEQVFVVGNSLGYGTCMTSGIVSDKSRNVNGKQLLMTDCAVNSGNSGGPMFNNDGQAIGVIVSGISGAEGMNFAIPSSTVSAFINQQSPSVRLTAGKFELPPTNYTVCPKCGSSSARVGSAGNCVCPDCGHRWSRTVTAANLSKKAKAPCPKCNSWNTNVENGIFYCEDCGFESG